VKHLHRISFPYPEGCNEPDSQLDCIRGENDDVYRFIRIGMTLFSIIYISVSMAAVYISVRNAEKNFIQCSFSSRLRVQNEKKLMKRSRRVMIQGILYSSALILLYVFEIINLTVRLITNHDTQVLLRISSIMITLQGLFNMLIYLVPVFRKMLKTYRQGKDTEEESRRISANLTSTPQPTETFNKEKLNSGGISGKHEEEEKREIFPVRLNLHDSMINTEQEDVEQEHDHSMVIDNHKSGSCSHCSGDNFG
jgi:hypothetical protein